MEILNFMLRRSSRMFHRRLFFSVLQKLKLDFPAHLLFPPLNGWSLFLWAAIAAVITGWRGVALPWRCVTAAAQQWKPLHVSHKIKKMMENLKPPLFETASSVRGLYRAAVEQTATAAAIDIYSHWVMGVNTFNFPLGIIQDVWTELDFLVKTIKLANMLKILRLGLTVPNKSAWKGNFASKWRYWLLMSKQQNPASRTCEQPFKTRRFFLFPSLQLKS